MNKSELKKVLKPLIKECIKEGIFEDGILSGIISEVAVGIGRVPTPTVDAAPAPTNEEENFEKIRQKSLQERKEKFNTHRKQLLSAIGTEAYNGIDLFEGTSPLKDGGSAPGSSPSPQGPLSGVSAGDSGVDITNLFGSVGGHWKAHMDGK